MLVNPLGAIGIGWLLLVAFAALLAPFVAPYDPNSTDLGAILVPPDAQHLMGTDSAGRDVFSRLLWGGQITLLSAALAAVVAIAIGVPTGLLAGYYPGWFDSSSNWTTGLVMSLPSIVVLLAARAALGPSVWISMSIFGVLLSPSFYRLVRTSVQGVRNELYVDAARVGGLSDVRIIGRHILFVVRAPIIIQAAMVGGIAIGMQSGLEFLGLGDPRVPAWGVMLSDAFRNIYLAPTLLIWPGVAISATIAALAITANALRDALEDRGIDEKRARAHRPAPASIPVVVADEADTPPSEERVLEVTDLTIAYRHPDGSPKVVVDGVTLHVDRGEVLGLVGESGSGKTQTAFSILGLLPDSARVVGGQIRLHGQDLIDSGSGRVSEREITRLRGRRIAYVPQEPMSNLDPAFTIGHQLTRPIRAVLGVSAAEARERALELLHTVGIVDPKRTFAAYPHEVSGGMAQRVLIAGAVSCEPELLIADEPTTALDVTVQAEVLNLLRELQADRQMAVLLVTHNFGVVADLCDRVAVMQNGRLVEAGEVRGLLRAPQHPYTKNLLAAMLEGKPPLTLLNAESKAAQR
ncbi:MAG: dipeptide/oligopeptide/nickel ABC transporter permease/ATP-binding protein [Cryobacterium sp.]|nr:dipeptide/oligopeptide/nickel ABC transporter permease/ATP-binding protein [Cryobacterium sp.]